MQTKLITVFVALFMGCAARAPSGVNIDQQWEEAKADPETVQLALATRLIAENSADTALALIAKMKRAGSTKVELDLLQGLGLMINNKPIEAIRILEKYQSSQPEDHRSYSALGLLYAENELIQEAVIQFTHTVKLEPNDASVYNNLGFLQMSLKQHESADLSFKKATALDATQPKYLTNMAYNLVALNQTEEALDVFLSVTTQANAHTQFGLALELKGATNLAINHYQTALQFEPSHQAAEKALNRLTTTALE